MLKHVQQLRLPDPYYSGEAGGIGNDMSKLELPASVPDVVRRYHDGIRNAYIYSYFAHDLLTLAASQTFLVDGPIR
jgi:hypothetical protein